VNDHEAAVMSMLNALALKLLIDAGGKAQMDAEDFTLIADKRIAFYDERGTIYYLVIPRPADLP
jgi:hypothetical protein